MAPQHKTQEGLTLIELVSQNKTTVKRNLDIYTVIDSGDGEVTIEVTGQDRRTLKITQLAWLRSIGVWLDADGYILIPRYDIWFIDIRTFEQIVRCKGLESCIVLDYIKVAKEENL